VVCAPTIEYHIAARNFTFVKALTRQELVSFFDCGFEDWENDCINLFQDLDKFQQVLPISQKESPEGNYFYYSSSKKDIQRYASAQDYKNALLKSSNDSLAGCIERNGHLGKLEITPFKVTIKGLDTELDFTHEFKRSEWDHLIGWL